MSKIGDLWFGLRAKTDELMVDVKKAGDKAGLGFGKEMAAGFKKSWSGANMGKGLVAGLGLAGGLGAFTLISGAVGKFTDLIGESIQAARDDQVSIQKLATSLRANVSAWDGQTDAIERTLKARMKLGFSDDEQRDSLARIVVATHDVNKALEVQRTAMDLARLKGISLAEAGDALIKVEGGQFRALKALGIVLKQGATATDALRAVQEAAAGQAEAYAQTQEGRVLVAQTKVNESMETFGYKILPGVTDAMVGAADTAVGLATTLDLLQSGTAKTVEGQQEQMQGVIDLQKALAILVPVYGSIADAEQDLLDQSVETAHVWDESSKDMTASTWDAVHGITSALDKAGDASDDWRTRFSSASGAVIRRANRVRTKLGEIAQGIIDGFYDPIETRANLHDIRLQLLADRETLRTAKTKEEKRQARDAIVSDLHDQATALVTLSDQGDLTGADVERFAKDARAQYGSMSKKAIADTEAIITKLRSLAGLKPKPITVPVVLDLKVSAADRAAWVSLTHHAWGHGPLMAEGGPVRAGQPYIVGEKRPELFVPDTNGVILPRVPSSTTAPGGGTGGGNTINVQLPVGPAPDPFATADALRRLNDFGVLR